MAAIVVGGYAVFSWLRAGRDPRTLDDPSILLPAPPPGMTAATATIVDGGGGHLAMTAALLDLASRDELAFEVEGRRGSADLVGIRIHGGETSDARIRLNRRKPIGEGETWLLSQLKLWASMPAGGHLGHDEPPTPEMMRAGMQAFASLMNAGLMAKGGDDSFQLRAAREHGLMAQGIPDIGQLAAAYEARTGKVMPERSRQMFERMHAMQQALDDPAAVAADPDRFIAQVEQLEGRSVPPEARAEIVRWATNASGPAATSTPGGQHIAAEQARHFAAPLFFGGLLETYAKRHGWVASLPFWTRLRWHALAVVEVLAGLLIAGSGQAAQTAALRSVGGGVAAGGVITFLVAPSMARVTEEGSSMRAQLAAYRRTLKATFAQAATLDQAMGSSRLPWLETPDQLLVWGVALGLRKDIEALMHRTGEAMRTGSVSGEAYVPAWYAGSGSSSGAVQDPVAMFEGIEAIGSEAYQASARAPSAKS